MSAIVTKEAVLEFLASLNERDFFELLARACDARRDEKTFEDGGFEIEAISIATHAFGRFRGETDREPYTQHYGAIHPEVADVEWWDGPCNSGKCEHCNALITTVAKIAVCPVCHTRVECT